MTGLFLLLTSLELVTNGYCGAPLVGAASLDTEVQQRDNSIAEQEISLQVVPSQLLSLHLIHPLTGLRWDSKEQRAVLLKQAQTYIQFKRGAMRSAEKASYLARCSQDRNVNPFCDYIQIKNESELENQTRSLASGKLNRSPIQVALDISRGDFSELAYINDKDFHRAMSHLTSFETLKIPAEKLLKTECESSTLPYALALKAEEYLPDPEARALVEKLFHRFVSCSTEETESVSKARFRLALFHLWKNDCSKAVPHLKKLGEQLDGDYTTRAVYWLGRCGDSKASAERLSRINPISYQILSLNQGKVPETWQTFKRGDRDQILLFRSIRKPELNKLIGAAEALTLLNNPDHAAQMIRWLEKKSKGTESGFRLYLSLLANRNHDSITHFRLLDSVFREDSNYVSLATLKLFFPLKSFQSIYQKSRNFVDPYLIAALIRQESAFRSNARSPVGALGLMQIMPATAWATARVRRERLYDPDTNVTVGVRYFRELMNRFSGDFYLALAGYNAGPLRVDEWKRRYTVSDRMLFLDLIPFSETRKYVSLISRNYFWYMTLYAPGGNDLYKQVFKDFSSMVRFRADCDYNEWKCLQKSQSAKVQSAKLRQVSLLEGQRSRKSRYRSEPKRLARQ